MNKEINNSNKISLEAIENIIRNKQFDKFFRAPDVQKRYDEWKRVSFLKDNLIKKIKERGELGNRGYLMRNDYPYNFEDGLEHWVIGYLDGDGSKMEFEGDRFDTHTDEAGGMKEEWKHPSNYPIGGINPIKYRSIQEIPHIHLVRNRKVLG